MTNKTNRAVGRPGQRGARPLGQGLKPLPAGAAQVDKALDLVLTLGIGADNWPDRLREYRDIAENNRAEADRMNQMQQADYALLEELRAADAGLDARVKERTADLKAREEMLQEQIREAAARELDLINQTSAKEVELRAAARDLERRAKKIDVLEADFAARDATLAKATESVQRRSAELDARQQRMDDTYGELSAFLRKIR